VNAEALDLPADRVDLAAHSLAFETLKKPKRGIFRAVPVPPDLVTITMHLDRECSSGPVCSRVRAVIRFASPRHEGARRVAFIASLL
jgi:hypothetical protein